MKTTTSNLLTIYERELKLALSWQDIKRIRALFEKANIFDFVDVFKLLTVEQQLIVIRCLSARAATEIINNLEKSELHNLIAAFSNPEIKKIVSKLYADDLVDLIDDLPHHLVQKIIASTSPAQRKDVNYILNYAENTIGSEMDVNFIAFKIDWHVTEAIAWIKQQKLISAERLAYYVVDDRGVLIGYVDVNDLLAKSGTNTQISALMETDVVSLRTNLLTEKAVEKMRRYQMVEMPVVDSHNKLVGVLNNDDVLELIQEAQIDDINKGAGIIEEPDTEYFATSSRRMFWSRFPWLAATIFITTFTQAILAWLMQKYGNMSEDSSSFVAFIVPFIPFILTIVGNIALQSTAIIVKNIVLKTITRPRYRTALVKELSVSVWILGAVLLLNLPRSAIVQIIVYGPSSFIEPRYWIRFGIISLIITFSVFFAILFSTLLPILAHWRGIDPALMSSPLLTTTIDLLVTAIAVGISFVFFITKLI